MSHAVRGRVAPGKVLKAASQAKLRNVLVLGRAQDGEMYAACSTGNEEWIVALLEEFNRRRATNDWKDPVDD